MKRIITRTRQSSSPRNNKHAPACVVCAKHLAGKQKRFCSGKCKSRLTNNKHQNYAAQRKRSDSRKLRLIKAKGGACSRCGYNRNYAALCFHHRNDKSFKLDARSLSNRSWQTIQLEAEKCDLLCHNCHMEIHHPNKDNESRV